MASQRPASPPPSGADQAPEDWIAVPEEVLALREQPAAEDADGQPIALSSAASAGKKPRGTGKRFPEQESSPRPSCAEVERRIAEAQLWIAQRLPLLEIRENARQSWGVTHVRTVSRYLDIARQRMVQELITDRRRHQAEQIFALNECARRAMEAQQFSAAVGAFRVIAEIGGLLRAPIKPPEPRG